MFRQLVSNTVFSGAAFFVAGLLGLVVIPVIIHAYGLTAFGLITLARLFLPTGFMAIFDFGVSETATLVIARARVSGSWTLASSHLSLLVAGSVALGVIAGGLLYAGSSMGNSLFRIDAAYHESFTAIVQATSAGLVLLFPGLCLDGIIKGYERYGLLRLFEVLSAAAYVLSVFVLVAAAYPYQAIAYAFLLTTAAKYVALAICILPILCHSAVRLRGWDRNNAREILLRSALMFHSRLLGVLQGQLPPLLIGALVGPSGVGTYDALLRLPRFVKSVLALLNSALLPVSARLNERGDGTGIMRLGKAGILFLPAITFPVLTGGAFFSEEIIREWLGPSMTALWPWLSLMFAVPFLSVLLSFGQTLLLIRPTAIAQLNMLLVLQLALQYVLSLALVGLLQERAFILGQVVAMAITFPLQMRVLLYEHGLPMNLLNDAFVKHAAVTTLLGTLGIIVKWHWGIHDLWGLAVVYSAWCLLYWGMAYAMLLSGEERAQLRRLVLAALGR